MHSASASIEQAFLSAVAQQQAGQLQQAAELYGSILQQHPQHAEANFNLDTIAAQLHMPTTASPLFMAALDANPDCSRYWISYLDTLALGRPAGRSPAHSGAGPAGWIARSRCRCVRTTVKRCRAGDHSDTTHRRHPSQHEFNALLALFRSGHLAEAEAQARVLTQRYPQHGMSWMVLGVALKNQGRSAEAIGPMRNAVELLPNDANAFSNLGGALMDVGRLPEAESVLRRMDIGVDCFPHNSGTTLYESLYMGVPFVTLASRPSLGRLGSSILTDAGHPEWIATNEDEYVEIAANLPHLATLRAGLRPHMQSGPLMDAAGYTQHVEAAYRAMFERWVHQHPA